MENLDQYVTHGLTQETWDAIVKEFGINIRKANVIGEHLAARLADQNYRYRSLVSWSTQYGSIMYVMKGGKNSIYCPKLR